MEARLLPIDNHEMERVTSYLLPISNVVVTNYSFLFLIQATCMRAMVRGHQTH